MRPISRFALCVVLHLLMASIVGTAGAVERLTAEEAARDVRVLKRALQELHPGLTKYQSETEWGAKLTRFETLGNAARTPEALYLAASELAAGVLCGHTWTNVLNQRGAIKTALLERPDKLPFRVQWVEDRLLVRDSTERRIRAGDEILAINGHEPPKIRAMMWPYLRADGASDSKRLRQLGHDRQDYSQLDIIWPLLSPPSKGRWDVRLQRSGKPRSLSVASVTLAGRLADLAEQGIQSESEAWQFDLEGDVALLTLPTFSFWNSDFSWQDFLRNSFNSMRARKTKFLIIDIRANEGGDGAIGGQILQYLIDQPLPYRSDQAVTRYERVPYVLARYLDTWDFDFFDRTGQVRAIVDGPQAGMLEFLPRAKGWQSLVPLAPRFEGKVFLLIGGENSSATFQFAQLAQRGGAATLVGQSTGGNLRGLSGGQLAWVSLPHSGVAVDIPLLASRYEADTPDAPIHPDVPVTRTFEGQRAGVDEEVAVVRRLIDASRFD